MIVLNILVVITTLNIGTTLAESAFADRPKTTEVDIIIDGLSKLDWKNEDQSCLDETLPLLHNVKNHTLWAVWMWNSMQRPSGTFYGSRHNLGSFDQCTRSASPLRAQYCLLDVSLNTTRVTSQNKRVDWFGSAETYLNSKPQTIKRDLSLLTWGVCLPAACSHAAVSKIARVMYSVSPLTAAQPDVTVSDCQVSGETTEYGPGYYAFMAIMAIIIGTSFISTYCIGKETRSPILDAFCLKRNANALFTPPTDDLRSLHYLKAVTVIFITCLHTGFFKLPLLGNGLDIDEVMKVKHVYESMIQHSDLVVFNFLLISSILLMRALLDKRCHPIVFLVARYSRLIGSFALIILYTTSVLIYTGDGPLWNKFAGREQKACQENWWLSLLMLNNHINGDHICQPVTWYLQCDYQLAALAVFLFCLWQKNRRIAKITIAAVFIVGILAPGIKTYWNRLPGTLLHNDIDQLLDIRTSDVYVKFYMRSHYRVAPFLVSLGMGCLMSIYKPEKNRGIIPKEWSIVALIVANTVAVRTVVAACRWCLQQYDAVDSALYAAGNAVLWTAAMCLNIAAMEYGDVGNELNAWIQFPGFVYISRLAYGIYLCHSLVIQQIFYSTRDPLTFSIFGTAIEGFGVLVISSVFSTLLWIFVDAPLGNLTGLALRKIFKPALLKKQPVAQNETNLACTIIKNKSI